MDEVITLRLMSLLLPLLMLWLFPLPPMELFNADVFSAPLSAAVLALSTVLSIENSNICSYAKCPWWEAVAAAPVLSVRSKRMDSEVGVDGVDMAWRSLFCGRVPWLGSDSRDGCGTAVVGELRFSWREDEGLALLGLFIKSAREYDEV